MTYYLVLPNIVSDELAFVERCFIRAMLDNGCVYKVVYTDDVDTEVFELTVEEDVEIFYVLEETVGSGALVELMHVRNQAYI